MWDNNMTTSRRRQRGGRKKTRIIQSKSYGRDIEAMLLTESRARRRRRSNNGTASQQEQPDLLASTTNADYVNKLTSILLIARLIQNMELNECKDNPFPNLGQGFA
jgi:hypothetical protein